jgi:hypothetical protein
MIRRRSLLAAPALILARRADAAFISFATHGLGTITAFPGQPVGASVPNPVGFAAAPGWPGSFQNGIGVWAGLPNPCSMSQLATFLGGSIPSGSPGTPREIKFLDIDGGGSSNSISADGAGHGAIHDVSFIGCRFQAASIRSSYNVDCFTVGSNNIMFSYCSMTPRRTAGPFYSKVPSPAVFDIAVPGSWPSSSVGTGLQDQGGGVAPLAGGGAGTYQTPYLSGSAFSIAIGATTGTYLIVDHCDMWGNAYGVSGAATSTTPVTVTDSWMHDNRFPTAPVWDPKFPYIADTTFLTGAYVVGSDGNNYLCAINNTGINPVGDVTGHWVSFSTNDHSEVLGYSQGGGPPPANWTVRHNTMATLGNTGVFVWQTTTGHYQNISMVNNYLSGTGEVIDLGTLASGGANTGWVFTDNIFATDLRFVHTCIDHSVQPIRPQFTRTGNVWRRNKLQLYPGSGATYASILAPFDGQFAIPQPPRFATWPKDFFSTRDWAF